MPLLHNRAGPGSWQRLTTANGRGLGDRLARRRRFLTSAVRWGGAAACALILAACAVQGPNAPTIGAAPDGQPPAARPGKAAAVKVVMLLPLTASGQTAAIAKGMKQAGELALFELDNPGFQLVVKDDKGTPEGARIAAEEAVKEGAEIILGPLFAKSVPGVAAVARPARVPVVSFSNDRSVAGDGVYVLGFLPEQDADRIVTYAVAQGKRRYAAMIADDAYGKLIGAAFREAVTRAGATLLAAETYPAETNRMVEPAERLVALIKEAADAGAPVDAVFVPGGPEVLMNLGPLLAYAEINAHGTKLMGTGGWDDPNLGRDATFVGGWYPAPDPRGWRQFSDKFARTFGSAPPRIASLAFDATTLAIALSGGPAGARFTPANLTRASGFAGVDGPVRLRANGTAERGLAILEVRKIGAAVVDPAPAGFGGEQLSSASNRVQ